MVEILLCNVQRSKSNQTALLEVAGRRKVDVVLIQEPRIHVITGTVAKAGYSVYGPGSSWQPSTKTITYVRNDIVARSIPKDNKDAARLSASTVRHSPQSPPHSSTYYFSTK